jgi:hypothetical protein
MSKNGVHFAVPYYIWDGSEFLRNYANDFNDNTQFLPLPHTDSQILELTLGRYKNEWPTTVSTESLNVIIAANFLDME